MTGVTQGALSTPAAALGAAFTIALVAAASWLFGAPMLAPPLGATAVICVIAPRANASAPRNVIVSHALACACGYVGQLASGAIRLPSAFIGGFQPVHILSVAIALGLTVLVTERLHVRHPPSGATTIIFGLGVLQDPRQLVAVACGAAITAYGACLVQLLAGREFPVWRPLDEVAARAARTAPGAETAR